MDALKKTLFVLALTSVTAYTVRHVYLKWFEPKESVLDKYSNSVSNDIKKATSLEELEILYSQAHQRAIKFDSLNTDPTSSKFDRQMSEPHQSESEIADGILEWENKSREIHKIRFYWTVGLLLMLCGLVLYKWGNQWLGLTFMITGFAEKVYWTSPTFWGGGIEYDRLLTNKIIFSIITLILLIVVGHLTKTIESTKQ